MRKFKQIFASFLAMNLTISTVAIGMMNVSAAENTAVKRQLRRMQKKAHRPMLRIQVAPEQVISETDAAYYSSDIG